MSTVDTLTGQARFRVNTEKYFLGKTINTLVLQVEVVQEDNNYHYSDARFIKPPSDKKYYSWRDAKVEDLMLLDINIGLKSDGNKITGTS